MSEIRLLQGAWIPFFWAALAVLCWLLPDSITLHWGILAQSWYWLLLAVLCNRWQHLQSATDQRASTRRRVRPAATLRRNRYRGTRTATRAKLA